MKRLFSLRVGTKLFISSLIVTLLAMSAVGYYTFTRRQEAIDYLSGQLLDLSRAKAEEQLTARVGSETNQIDNLLKTVQADVDQTADQAGKLLNQVDVLGQGMYWDARKRLTPLTQGQLGNPNDEPASVYVPQRNLLTEARAQELNALRYLDFVAPGLLTQTPNMVALYFNDPGGASVYYPNIDLASVVGNLDPTTQSFYTIATPENDPSKSAVWTVPYQDPAGSGLIVTVSRPVYDSQGKFRGVMSADIRLADISKNIANIVVGDSGYAFLIDSAGHVLGMPERGYADFGLTSEVVAPGEAPKQTVLGKGSATLQDATDKMRRGGSGLATFQTADGSDHYIAYTQVPATSYSLGLVVPTSETTGQAVAAAEQIIQETRQSTVVGIGLFIFLAIVVSVVQYLGARSLTRPLVKLTNTAHEIAGGNLDAVAPVTTGDEIGTLATTFNNMTGQLRDMINSLETRVELRTAQIQASADVGRAAASILDPDNLLEQVVRLITERFGFYYAAAFVVDASGKWAVLREASGPGNVAWTLKKAGHRLELDGSSMVAAAIRRRNPRVALDVGEEAVRFANPLLPDTRSEAALPLIVGDETLGALDVQSIQARAFDETSLTTQQAMVDQIAVALNNARQYRRERTRAQHTIGLLEATLELTTQIDRTQLYERIAELSMKLLNCDGVGVWLPVEDNELELRYSVNIGPTDMTGRRLRRGEGLSGQAFASGHVIRVDDYVTWRERAAAFADAPFHAAMSVPFIWQGRTTGVLALTRSQADQAFTTEDESTAQLFATQAAATLENMRLIDQVQTTLDEISLVNKRLTGEAWQTRLRGESVAYEYRRIEQGRSAEVTLRTPIELHGQPIGVVTLTSDQPERELNDDERDIVESVAQQMALALESARLFEQTQMALGEARRLAQRERMINRIVGRLRGAVSVDEVLRIATDEMRQAVRATYATAKLAAPDAEADGGNGTPAAEPAQRTRS